jgi:hypothetical protein
LIAVSGNDTGALERNCGKCIPHCWSFDDTDAALPA